MTAAAPLARKRGAALRSFCELRSSSAKRSQAATAARGVSGRARGAPVCRDRLRPAAFAVRRSTEQRGGKQRQRQRPAQSLRQHGIGNPQRQQLGARFRGDDKRRGRGRGDRRAAIRMRDLLHAGDRRSHPSVDREAEQFGSANDRVRHRAVSSSRDCARRAAGGRRVPDRRCSWRRKKASRSIASSSPRRMRRALAAAALRASRRRQAPAKARSARTRTSSSASAAPARNAAASGASDGTAPRLQAGSGGDRSASGTGLIGVVSHAGA